MKCPNCKAEIVKTVPEPGKPGRVFGFCPCTPGRPVLATDAPVETQADKKARDRKGKPGPRPVDVD